MQQTASTTNSEQVERAEAFRGLHHQERPLLLANAWSASSARIAEAAGAAAIGTTSFGMALDHGRPDGGLPFEVVLAVTAEIVAAVDVPVTLDLEAGRGDTPADVAESTRAALATGVVGVNVEDAVPGSPGTLFDVDAQCERLRAVRAAADAFGVPLFVNARCDVFFGATLPPDRAEDEVRERAAAYRDAGADGLFLPGLIDLATIARLAPAIGLPLNVMVLPGLPEADELAEAGVQRVSMGGAGFLAMAGALQHVAAAYVAGQVHPPLDLVAAGFGLMPTLAR